MCPNGLIVSGFLRSVRRVAVETLEGLARGELNGC